MSVVATALRELIQHGVTGDALVEAVARIEAAAYPRQAEVAAALERTKAAERTKRWREKRASQKPSQPSQPSQTVTETSPRDGSPPSPIPPSTSPVTPNPFTPLKGGVSPSLAEQIFLLQPLRNGKRRSTRPDVKAAAEAAVKRGGRPDEIVASVTAYYRLPDSTKDGGEYAMGAARLLAADRWRDFLPTPEPPPMPVDGAVLAKRLQHLRDTGEWKPHWGERPRNAA